MKADTPLNVAQRSFPKGLDGHDFEFKTKITGPDDKNYDLIRKRFGITSSTIIINSAQCKGCGISFLYRQGSKDWTCTLYALPNANKIAESCSEYHKLINKEIERLESSDSNGHDFKTWLSDYHEILRECKTCGASGHDVVDDCSFFLNTESKMPKTSHSFNKESNCYGVRLKCSCGFYISRHRGLWTFGISDESGAVLETSDGNWHCSGRVKTEDIEKSKHFHKTCESVKGMLSMESAIG